MQHPIMCAFSALFLSLEAISKELCASLREMVIGDLDKPGGILRWLAEHADPA